MPSTNPHAEERAALPAPLATPAVAGAPEARGAKLGLLAGLFNGNRQERHFRHFERVFAGDAHKVSLAKAMWLTRQGQKFAGWGNTLKARQYLAEAIAIKSDYLPAYVHLCAAYRETAQTTGVLTLLEAAKDLFDSIPRRIRLLDREVGLEECGAAVHAEWAHLYAVVGEWDEAENHLLLALQCHERAQRLSQDLRDFLHEIGCFVSPGFEAYLRRVLAGLPRQAAG